MGRALGGGGAPTRDLERLLIDRYSAERVHLVGSGTQALQLALLLGAEVQKQGGKGAGVILPAFSCFDLVSAVVGAGVPCSFYDVDPATLSPDLDSLRRTLEPEAGILVVAPLFGYPAPWDDLVAVARDRGVLVIEDAAQSFGLEAISHGDATVLSFGRGKGWTGGGGGALVLPPGSPLLGIDSSAPGVPAERTLLPWAVSTGAQWVLGRPSLYGLPSAVPGLGLGETTYSEPGPLRGMSHASAALALATLPASLEAVRVRRLNARRVLGFLPGADAVGEVRPTGGEEPAFLRLPVRLDRERIDSPAVKRLAALGVLPSYPRPLPDLLAEVRRLPPPASFPGAVRAVNELFTVPTHPFLSSRDVDRLREALIAL